MIKILNLKLCSKYKNIFTKGYAASLFEEGFVIEKVTNTVPWTDNKIP